jgi:hypothetical protein
VLRAALACLLLGVISCGGGESSGPPVATTLAANSATAVNGVVGAIVTPAPSVIVKDQNGSPMGGETVTFAVVSGGGLVSGATVTTDVAGVATVGSWTLGPAAGENVLRATSGTLAGVDFTATSSAGAAASIAKNAGDNQAALAGSAVPIPPSVLVKDANGNPKAGVAVTFAIESGGGAITGAVATTNASGIATVGSWTLGPAIGQNVLRATSGTLQSVLFTASSVAGAAASVAKNAGDNQSALAGTPVPIPPSVLVKDANGNPRPGAAVTFAVVSGGGSVTGAAAVTNTAGIAAVGSWTLGSATGANSLSATVAGLPAVTFVATATSSFCTNNRGTHTFGTSSAGTLSSSDCQFPDGSFVDFFNTSVPEAGAYLFRQGATFDTYLLLAMPNGVTIGENDDEVETNTNSGIKALLPAGEYLLGPGSFEPGVTGDYTISSTAAPTDVGNCETVFVVRNITTNQNLAATDCNVGSAASPIYSDVFFIFLNAGASVTINMTSGGLDSYLQLVRLDGLVVAENDNVSGTTKDARVTFTATQTNYYAIFARSIPATATGAYTLTVQ